ncbi:MAG: hypothetical protein QM767_20695 [Anaeromyxobacter sp.]
MAAFTLEFYENERGDKPVLRWIREELAPTQRFGNKVVLLLAGYDKGADTSPRRQDEEIAVARQRLAAWRRGRA